MGVLLVAGVGGGYLYIQQLNGNIRQGQLNNGDHAIAPAPEPNAAGQRPLNVLVIGSDGRSSAADCKLGGSCDGSAPHADVEMLVHLSADRSNASVLSIPRDTQVAIPDCTNPATKALMRGRHSIITDSLNVGDPSCVVDTWENLTKIHIDHYMMIDFAGVVSMADAIGGVEVCARQNVVDYDAYTDPQGVHHEVGSHLVFPAGTRKVAGEQALEWLRTRHAWEDGSDIGRTHAQHLYLNSMIRELKSARTLTDVGKLNDLAQAATKALQVDTKLASVTALADLALDFNKVPAARITTVTMPFVYVPDPKNPKAALVETTPDSSRLFQLIVNDTPLDRNGPATASPASTTPPAPAAAPVDKAGVHLSVLNGSGTARRSVQLVDALVAQGFTHATRDTTTIPAAPTELSYPTAQLAEAQAVAAALGLPASALTPSASATHLSLTVGKDWTTGNTFPNIPVPTAVPTTAVAQNAQDDAGQCMDVNPERKYTWTGPNPPNVPQP